ncbi:MAG TPA: SGNH/GDSL hydrolase family protein [Allosphingosinicella sp.]|jgi:lysophospholipase L1-like esterase|nr:SGNH/GDSL hydrolase family protein [Allosphingosinicella sp.]
MRRVGLALALALLVPSAASTAPAEHWVGSWASAQQVPEPQNSLADTDLSDTTLREHFRLSLGGSHLRVRLSNLFGTQPLVIDAATVGRAADPAGNALVPGSVRPLTFAGATEVTIPAGAEYLSDPVALDAPPLATLAISLHFPHAPARQTGHPGSRATTWIAAGNQTGSPVLHSAKGVEHWYELASVEVEGQPGAASVVAFGDSITDGHGVGTNRNTRWPDVLAERLQAAPATRGIGVLNLGIGGNRLLLDGLGPNALARFDRDVLGEPGVRWAIVLEGVNDLGTFTRDTPQSPAAHQAHVRQIIAALAQMEMRARAHGVFLIGGTIMPFGASAYYHPDAATEADRQAINRWIRTPGHFDALIDFDALTRDPAHPERLSPAFDSGDGLHPSEAGYRAMGEAIPLSLFARR